MEQSIKVSDNCRYLITGSGTPFFYLGDTAWELFHRLDRDEASYYLQTRADQGFTVIQAVVLAEHEFEKPNAYGDHPLVDNDPMRPNEAYFRHVDYIVDRAAELGIVTGMLPTWGDKWNIKWGKGPLLFEPRNAYGYGKMLGARYRDRPIIWILGGDRPIETENHAEVIRAMAEGLSDGDGGRHLRTFHPMGQQTSSKYFHTDNWLDFNMYQTGHSRNGACYAQIAADYACSPVKPCMDAEPGYEDHPNGFNVENGYLDDYDVRKSAYWDLFAGAFGHTYGCHDIWQFLNPERFAPVTFARTPWKEAIHLPGASQMQHLRALMESRPFLSRIPDQALIIGSNENGPQHIRATRDEDGSYAFLYIPAPVWVTIDVSRLTGSNIRAHWFDPRTGQVVAIGTFAKDGNLEIAPRSDGPDWVLVLDDADRGYGIGG